MTTKHQGLWGTVISGCSKGVLMGSILALDDLIAFQGGKTFFCIDCSEEVSFILPLAVIVIFWQQKHCGGATAHLEEAPVILIGRGEYWPLLWFGNIAFTTFGDRNTKSPYKYPGVSWSLRWRHVTFLASAGRDWPYKEGQAHCLYLSYVVSIGGFLQCMRHHLP